MTSPFKNKWGWVWAVVMVLLLAATVYAKVYTRGATALTGGTTGALDSYDGTDLQDGDTARVVTSTSIYHFILDADSAASESSPEVVSPDSNAGDKRWVKVGVVTKVSIANTDNPPTDAQLDSAFGAPATVGKGFIGIVNDNNGGTNEYLCWSDGTNWFYATGVKAL